MSTGSLSSQEEALFSVVSQILDELQTLLPRFAAHVVLDVYKAYPDISMLFEKRQVKALQRELDQRAEEATLKIIGKLANEELWLLDNARKVRESLHQNTQVWQVVQEICPVIDQLLESYGYPPELGPQGKYFPQTQLQRTEQLGEIERLKVLSIKYWSGLMRFKQQRVDQVKQQQAAHHRKLDEMWHH